MESFQLFQDGFTIEQIAEQRKLTQGTIQGHLANAIRVGKLRLIDVMEAEKGLHILKTIAANPDKGITEIKNILGDDYSFGDVRLGMAQLERNGEG